MTPTIPARLLSRAALAFGWVTLAFFANAALAVNPLPPCDSKIVNNHCEIFPQPKDRHYCSQWNKAGEAACQGDAKAMPPVASQAREDVQRTFDYCKDVSSAVIELGWTGRCVPWTQDGNSVERPCYRVYYCVYDSAAVTCSRDVDNYDDVPSFAYTWADCFNIWAVAIDAP
jgi:hypothetical protein